MSLWKEYYFPSTLKQALQLLSESPQPARIIAGGTDLLLDIQQGRQAPVHTLIDVTRIQELNRLEVDGDYLFVGAAVPIHCIADSPLVKFHARALAEGCSMIGGPQVRNVATLGGNVAHALPAADGTIGLVALDALAEIIDAEDSRLVPILDLFQGPGRSSLMLGKDILVGFRIPLRHFGQASSFQRIMRPQGVALPILNMAVWIEREGTTITQTRIAVGPSGPKPQRASTIETFLAGKPWNRETISEAIQLMRQTFSFRTSPYRATAEYRLQVCKQLFVEVFSVAWERAGEEW
ncbi:aerobic-type carbon monoxide dehydrogenase, middle subunit CoxM/CutM homologs [Anaerolinea thermolimosa]|uniref:FAD binding domain-containing protein n=1 Tax=Anaerolinea thermolimosa TaxID=229919 RepID=UPI00078342DB|nr:FAD binding domain-containing protein [Anaerolinea thermolimosa]GAP06529.1 aerobic-type carbon monoxide dehydrogenase, middle subunit CoxM/CutM homologs [Anaerolinea thermolimosa]